MTEAPRECTCRQPDCWACELEGIRQQLAAYGLRVVAEVFVPYVGDYSDRRSIGVYSTRALAVAATESNATWQAEQIATSTLRYRAQQVALGRPLPDPYDIEKYALDAPPEG